jgi:hypothetical protein
MELREHLRRMAAQEAQNKESIRLSLQMVETSRRWLAQFYSKRSGSAGDFSTDEFLAVPTTPDGRWQ